MEIRRKWGSSVNRRWSVNNLIHDQQISDKLLSADFHGYAIFPTNFSVENSRGVFVVGYNLTGGGSIFGEMNIERDGVHQLYHLRKSKNTEVDVRIIDNEITIKLVQQKRINCLLFCFQSSWWTPIGSSLCGWCPHSRFLQLMPRYKCLTHILHLCVYGLYNV